MKDLLLFARMAFNKQGSFGGVVVSSRILYSYVRKHHSSQTTFIDSYKNYKIFSFFIISTKLFFKIFHHKIIFLNLNEREIIFFGLPFVFMSRLLKKTIIVRFFGGNLDILEQKNIFYSIIIKYIFLYSNLVLLQTKHICKYYNKYSNITHFPTCRPYKPLDNISRNVNPPLKLIYIGHLSKSKGLDLILRTASQLLQQVEFSLYGKLMDYSASQLNSENVSYQGEVSNDRVHNLLQKFDFLCLPSIHEGEGYPGVIIESFMAKTPVICSNWRSLPELVKPDITGILFKPNCVDDFVLKLKSLPSNPRLHFKSGLELAIHNYDSNKIYSSFFNRILV